MDTASYTLTGDPGPLEEALQQATGSFESLGDSAKASMEGVETAAKNAWAAVTGGASRVLGAVSGAFSKVYSVVTAPFTAAYNVVSRIFSRIYSTVTGVFSSLYRGVTGFASEAYGILKGLVPLLGVGLFAGIAHGLSEFQATEAGLFKVANAVKATGGVAGFTADQLKAMADEMQKVTTYGDDAALSAEAVLLQFKNIRGDIFKGALLASADLASHTGTDLPSAADKLARALDNPMRGIKTLRSEIGVFTEAEADMIEQMTQNGQVMQAQQYILQRVSGIFGGAAAAEAKTFGGQVKMLNNYLNDAWKTVAAALVPALSALIPWIKSSGDHIASMAGWLGQAALAAVDFAKTGVEWMSKWAGKVMEYVNAVADWLIDRMGEAFTFVETIFTDFPAFFDRVTSDILYYWEALKQGMKQMWHEVTSYMTGSMNDALKGIVTALNMVMSNVITPALIKTLEAVSYTTGKSKFGGLTIGQIKDLNSAGAFTFKPPKVEVSAPVSDEDKKRLDALREKANQAAEAFGAKFGANMEKNKPFIDGLKKKFGELLGLEGEAGEGASAFAAKGVASGEEYAIAKEAKGASAFEDLMALQKRIAGSAFKSPEQTAIQAQTGVMKQHNEKQLKKMDEQKKATEEVKDALKDFKPDPGTEYTKFAD